MSYEYCWNVEALKKIFKQLISPNGNRTRVSRVTGGDTDLYTIEDSEMIPESANPRLELTLISGPVRFPSNFRCYEGIQNTGKNSSCDNHCRYGIDCMCIKIDNVPGKIYDSCGTARAYWIRILQAVFFHFHDHVFSGNGTVRGCWANPHSALTPGCMVNNFRVWTL